MPNSDIIHVVSCHAEGEVGDVIVAGVPPPPGDTIWEQRTFIEQDESLRNLVLNEPRGGIFRHVNLLVPPVHPDAQAAFIIMEPADTPPMSGSNSICVATVLLNTGILPMTEPETDLVLEAPGGLIRIKAFCEDGKAKRIKMTNVASFVDRRDASIEVEGLGTLRVDTAYGGDSFAIVDAAITDLVRPALYGAFHFAWSVAPGEGLVPPERSANLELPGTELIDVVGPVCETGDFLAKDRRLPPIARGDLLCVFSTGAYGFSMSSQYNSRPRPAEVLVDDNQVRVIRRRETYDDLVEAERD